MWHPGRHIRPPTRWHQAGWTREIDASDQCNCMSGSSRVTRTGHVWALTKASLRLKEPLWFPPNCELWNPHFIWHIKYLKYHNWIERSSLYKLFTCMSWVLGQWQSKAVTSPTANQTGPDKKMGFKGYIGHHILLMLPLQVLPYRNLQWQHRAKPQASEWSPSCSRWRTQRPSRPSPPPTTPWPRPSPCCRPSWGSWQWRGAWWPPPTWWSPSLRRRHRAGLQTRVPGSGWTDSQHSRHTCNQEIVIYTVLAMISLITVEYLAMRSSLQQYFGFSSSSILSEWRTGSWSFFILDTLQ